PFASAERYELMVLPLKHQMNFSNISDNEISKLAYIFKNIFSKYKINIGEISFNIYFDTYFKDEFNDSFHWKIKIIPRFSTYAGFEIATGIHINTILPENIIEKFKF
ncbi:MAG: galactose-1-phosphate uridylyltransferase, partial [Senegalia sp. (in: firmicutes)]